MMGFWFSSVILLTITLGGCYSAMSGDYFILGLAEMNDGQATVYVSTVSLTPIDVALGVRCDGYKVNTTVQIRRGQSIPFCVTEDMIYDQCWNLVLKGTGEFSVVLKYTHGTDTDTTVVLPVSAFGRRYHFKYLYKRTRFIVIGAHPAKTRVHIKFYRPHEDIRDLFQYKQYVDVDGESSSKIETYCEERPEHLTTALNLDAEQSFGVMLSYCELCGRPSPTYNLEMLLPMNTYGRHIVNLKLKDNLDLKLENYLVVIAPYAMTTLGFFDEGGERISTRVVEMGHLFHSTDLLREVAIIESNNPIAVYFHLQNTVTCKTNDAFSLLVPVELFLNFYYWTAHMPNSEDIYRLNSDLQVIFILREPQRKMLILDGILLDEAVLSMTPNSRLKWHAYPVPINPGYHSAYTLDGAPFGCYIYLADVTSVGLHPAGYITGEIPRDQRRCQKTAGVPGDKIDNDCDGYIDEESAFITCSLKDLDQCYNTHQSVTNHGNDYRDLALPPPITGKWSKWSEWHCSVDCGASEFYVRRRSCDSPAPSSHGTACVGVAVETHRLYCDTQVRCQNACRRGFFGPRCTKNCSNCESECVKDTGYCPLCKRGWKGYACQQACDPMTYGYNCKYSCAKKCGGKDCIDREMGICPPSFPTLSLIVFWYVLVLVPLVGVPAGIFISRHYVCLKEVDETNEGGRLTSPYYD